MRPSTPWWRRIGRTVTASARPPSRARPLHPSGHPSSSRHLLIHREVGRMGADLARCCGSRTCCCSAWRPAAPCSTTPTPRPSTLATRCSGRSGHSRSSPTPPPPPPPHPPSRASGHRPSPPLRPACSRSRASPRGRHAWPSPLRSRAMEASGLLRCRGGVGVCAIGRTRRRHRTIRPFLPWRRPLQRRLLRPRHRASFSRSKTARRQASPTSSRPAASGTEWPLGARRRGTGGPLPRRRQSPSTRHRCSTPLRPTSCSVRGAHFAEQGRAAGGLARRRGVLRPRLPDAHAHPARSGARARGSRCGARSGGLRPRWLLVVGLHLRRGDKAILAGGRRCVNEDDPDGSHPPPTASAHPNSTPSCCTSTGRLPSSPRASHGAASLSSYERYRGRHAASDTSPGLPFGPTVLSVLRRATPVRRAPTRRYTRAQDRRRFPWARRGRRRALASGKRLLLRGAAALGGAVVRRVGASRRRRRWAVTGGGAEGPSKPTCGRWTPRGTAEVDL